MPPCPTAVRHRPDRAVYVRRDARSLTCGSGDVLHPGPTPGSGRGVGRSRSEVRAPSGISNRCSNAVACAAVSGAARVSHSRCIAVSRTRATSWASVDTPGSSTWRSRSQTSAHSNRAFGPSPVVHARSSTHRASSSASLSVLDEPVGVADLRGVLEPGHLPHPVGLHTRRVGDVELFGQVVHDLGRDVGRIGQEPTNEQQTS